MGNTVLYYACDTKNIEVIELLLSHPDIDVNVKNSDGDTPLHRVILRDSIEILQLLLAQPNINVNAENKNNITALHISIFSTLKVIEILLNYPKTNINIKDDEGNTFLHRVCKYYIDRKFNVEDIKFFLKNGKIDVNIKNNEGNTPLHLLCKKNRIEVFQFFLNYRKTDVNVQNINGDTCLHLLCNSRYYEDSLPLVELILAHPKIKLNIKNNKDLTPVITAYNSQNSQVLELLILNTSVDLGYLPYLIFKNIGKDIYSSNYDYEKLYRLTKERKTLNLKTIKSILDVIQD